MGLFVSSHPSSVNSASFSGSKHAPLSIHEIKHNVRTELHDRLGRTKGEEVFNMLSQDLDRDNGIGSSGVSGREVDDLLHSLRTNHQDNLHDSDIGHVEEVLRKHFNE